MTVIRAKDYDDMSAKAANLIFAQIIMKPDSVLGLPTGSTVLGLYGRLRDYYWKGDLDFSRVRTFCLDEYVGLDGDNRQSFGYYMNKHLFDHINIEDGNAHLPDGLAADLEEECERYNDLIESLGGVDVQVLGLGGNGHIGFNEPGDYFKKSTHLVNLDESTISANARFFKSIDEVPREAITVGVGNILSAKKIILCVSGEQKADILRQVLTGNVTPQVPASILQFHPDCIVVADEDALKNIPAD